MDCGVVVVLVHVGFTFEVPTVDYAVVVVLDYIGFTFEVPTVDEVVDLERLKAKT